MRNAVKRFLEVNNCCANDKVGVQGALPGLRYSSGLKLGSEVCSEQMNDWQHLSLRDLEQNEFFPICMSWGFLVP